MAGAVAVVAVRRKRRAARPGGRRSVHDARAAGIVDGALDELAGDLLRLGRPVPGIILVTVDAGQVLLRLASPNAEPPAPWLATANDTIWTRPAAGIRPPVAATGSGHRVSGLVSVGPGAGSRTLVDLSEAGGLVAVAGDRRDRLDAAGRWVDDFARNPWSRGLPMLLVGPDGFPAEFPDGGAVSAVTVDTLTVAVSRGGAGLAVVDEALPGPAGLRLRRALESPDCRWAVVVLGAADGARWRFEARPDGSVTSEVFPAAALAGAPVDTQVRAGILR